MATSSASTPPACELYSPLQKSGGEFTRRLPDVEVCTGTESEAESSEANMGDAAPSPRNRHFTKAVARVLLVGAVVAACTSVAFLLHAGGSKDQERGAADREGDGNRATAAADLVQRDQGAEDEDEDEHDDDGGGDADADGGGDAHGDADAAFANSVVEPLPPPTCRCWGKMGPVDAYQGGARRTDKVLCMSPWGEPSGQQHCYPPSEAGTCRKTAKRCDNSPAAAGRSRTRGGNVRGADGHGGGGAAAPRGPCLCAFDIDRTLTSKQGDHCAKTRPLSDSFDAAFGGGPFTLSALAASGVASTPCGACYVGIVSQGSAKGSTQKNRKTLVQAISTEPFRELAATHHDATRWSTGSLTWPAKQLGYGPGHVRSPLVVRQGNAKKQWAVEGILEWYASKGVHIARSNVWFFDDRADNVLFFNGTGMNARQISCGSRDAHRRKVGFCGAKPKEIELTPGVVTCMRSQVGGAAGGGGAPRGG
mmetsp:Transcript_108319/g.305384  ORF Transcript_108319/g.305384 Transcript_108319/m.305384 type:complete len:479 (-) Transcript_108319:156-1592(-)